MKNQAKRSQSVAPHHSTIPLFQHSCLMPIVRNEPNLAAGKMGRKCLADIGLWMVGIETWPEKTKPIRGESHV